jgi:hypothetical protein
MANLTTAHSRFLTLGMAESEQLQELVERLDSNRFNPRSHNSSRRCDGTVVLGIGSISEGRTVQLRLNAYEYGLRGIVDLCVRNGSAEARGLMIRPSRMDADSREFIATLHAPSPSDRSIIGNIIYGACKCLGRGSVRIEEGKTGASFDLFLPSGNPLPSFNQNFEVVGLPSMY